MKPFSSTVAHLVYCWWCCWHSENEFSDLFPTITSYQLTARWNRWNEENLPDGAMEAVLIWKESPDGHKSLMDVEGAAAVHRGCWNCLTISCRMSSFMENTAVKHGDNKGHHGSSEMLHLVRMRIPSVSNPQVANVGATNSERNLLRDFPCRRTKFGQFWAWLFHFIEPLSHWPSFTEAFFHHPVESIWRSTALKTGLRVCH